MKTSTIFEAAINLKLEKRINGSRLCKNLKLKVLSKNQNLLKRSNYLNYVVNEWMKENELIEKGIKERLRTSLTI